MAERLQPNVLVFLWDNIGWGEVGCYGGGVLRGAPTPRIDGLAAGRDRGNVSLIASQPPNRVRRRAVNCLLIAPDSSTQHRDFGAFTGQLVVHPAALNPTVRRPRRYSGSRSKLTPVLRAEIVAARATGQSLREIATAFDLSHQTIADVVRQDAPAA
jgi:Helix-turn-helix domain